MRRLSAVSLFLFSLCWLALFLSGCSGTASGDLDRIARPANNTVFLEGTWKIETFIGNDNATAKPLSVSDSALDGKMGFSGQRMAYGGNCWENVTYKVKRVNVSEYFLHKNADVLKGLAGAGDEILVYTAYFEDKFLYEFVRISDEAMIVSIDEQYYSMKKISDKYEEAEEAIAAVQVHPDAEDLQARSQVVRSGILLGIRTPVKTNDSIGDYQYKTYWISSADRVFRPVLSAGDIYLPRMNGFWKMKTEKRMGPEGTEDILTAFMAPKLDEKQSILAVSENYSKRVETKLRSAVVYVGNDYVCVENTVLGAGQTTTSSALVKTLRTLPVDNLENIEGIKISDLAGENGSIAMDSAVTDLIKGSGYRSVAGLDESSLQESFALYRKTGHWFFKGRLNHISEGQPSYMDFSLNLIPPSNMVAYDILQVPWTEIKDRIPQAVDIYTSPNKDIAIVLTRNSILLYPIQEKSLAAQPSLKLAMTEGSSVIMAEWAMGDYVQSWEKSFVKNNEIKQEAGIK